jgi:hypothetical protein
MTIKSISAAIDRSISHTETVHLDLSDLAAAFAEEAREAGDVDGERLALCWQDEQQTVMGMLLYPVTSSDDLDDVDHVDNGDVCEIWGTRDGADWRVHVRLDA